MKKYSKNVKLNNVLTEIERQLKELGIGEVMHYTESFPNVIDYNIVQYGNLLIYHGDIQEMYKNAGYKTKFSDNQAWEIYRRQVGYVARELVKNN